MARPRPSWIMLSSGASPTRRRSSGDVTIVDVFSGAGGLSLGFKFAIPDSRTVLAVEVDPMAANTFARNFDCDLMIGPIEKCRELPHAEILLGGPPCQGFSRLGRSTDETKRQELNELWRVYIEVARQIRPLAFVIENVPEFLRSPQFSNLCSVMSSDPILSKYSYSFGTLDAADYGVPQHRVRALVVAILDSEPVEQPPVTHGRGPSTKPYTTVRDAIGDLPLCPVGKSPAIDMKGSQNLHFGRDALPSSIERYRAIPEGGNRFDLARNRPDLLPRCWASKASGTTDVMGRLWWDKPSCTIRTEFFKPEKGRYLHPVADRAITHREAARLQSFPDSFVFEGSKADIARQIGNAVPPALATVVARQIANRICRI